MGKLGWLQDLTRGVMKLCKGDKSEQEGISPVQQIIHGFNPTVNSLLERAQLFLEDGNWEEANQYADRVLDIEPKNVKAYLFKLLSKLNFRSENQLSDAGFSYKTDLNFQKVLRFADEELKSKYEDYCEKNEQKILLQKREQENYKMYLKAIKAMDQGKYEEAITIFDNLEEYKDAKDKKEKSKELLLFEKNKEKEIIERKKREKQLEVEVNLIRNEMAEKLSDYKKIVNIKEQAKNKMESVRGAIGFHRAQKKLVEKELSETYDIFVKKRQLKTRLALEEKQIEAMQKNFAAAEKEYNSIVVPQQPDVSSMIYEIAIKYYQNGFLQKAYSEFTKIPNYQNATEILKKIEESLKSPS